MGPRPRFRDAGLMRRPREEDRTIPRPFRVPEPRENVGTGVRPGQGEEGGWVGRQSSRAHGQGEGGESVTLAEAGGAFATSLPNPQGPWPPLVYPSEDRH
jgi:hypothetical protein